MSRISEAGYFKVASENLINPLAQGFTAFPSDYEGRWGIANWFDCLGNTLFSIALKKEPLWEGEKQVYVLETPEGVIYELAKMTTEVWDRELRPLLKAPHLPNIEKIEEYLNARGTRQS